MELLGWYQKDETLYCRSLQGGVSDSPVTPMFPSLVLAIMDTVVLFTPCSYYLLDLE